LKIPPFTEFEEFKEMAFALAYPGNGEAPWFDLFLLYIYINQSI